MKSTKSGSSISTLVEVIIMLNAIAGWWNSAATEVNNVPLMLPVSTTANALIMIIYDYHPHLIVLRLYYYHLLFSTSFCHPLTLMILLTDPRKLLQAYWTTCSRGMDNISLKYW